MLMVLAFCTPPPLLSASSFSPDIFSSMSILPSLKVCLDLSAEYLILSDVQRKVGGSLDCWLGGWWRRKEQWPPAGLVLLLRPGFCMVIAKIAEVGLRYFTVR